MTTTTAKPKPTKTIESSEVRPVRRERNETGAITNNTKKEKKKKRGKKEHSVRTDGKSAWDAVRRDDRAPTERGKHQAARPKKILEYGQKTN